jgi:hypothetical protein
MGRRDQARKALFLALGMSVLVAVILFLVSDALSRLIGLGAELAFFLIFPKLMEKEFGEWEATHPDIEPSSGWKAIGWGLLGTVIFLLVAVAVFIALAAIFPHAAE